MICLTSYTTLLMMLICWVIV